MVDVVDVVGILVSDKDEDSKGSAPPISGLDDPRVTRIDCEWVVWMSLFSFSAGVSRQRSLDSGVAMLVPLIRSGSCCSLVPFCLCSGKKGRKGEEKRKRKAFKGGWCGICHEITVVGNNGAMRQRPNTKCMHEGQREMLQAAGASWRGGEAGLERRSPLIAG